MSEYIQDSSLEGLELIGCGGFGQVYKGRHRQLACDVAVKLLHPDDGNNKLVLREINMMCQGRSPQVVHVYGVYRGRAPGSGATPQLGVVMELMERGSLFSLQETLGGPPPWPLVFRLAHQVAQGLNFLHSLKRPVLHLDLKPHNVLLDDGLNAKLTDFGLAQISHSVSLMTTRGTGPEGGTISYMPPEAFGPSYKPGRASDIYSLGVLLWSLVTGKQPYQNAPPCLVALQVPKGQRPPLDELRAQAVRVGGLTGLMDLMVRCWDKQPERRPCSLVCTTEARALLEPHRPAVPHAVYLVLKNLTPNGNESRSYGGAQAAVEESQQWGAPAGLDVSRVDAGGVQTLRREDLRRYAVELSVDLNTVSEFLELSPDNRKLLSGRPLTQYPAHPDRFQFRSQLLCREALSGRCYWEVEWTGAVYVAVCYKGLNRKGRGDESGFWGNDQSWCLSCCQLGYSVWHNNRKRNIPSLSPSAFHAIYSFFSDPPYRVGVFLDTHAGTLSFYQVNLDTLIHLHTFTTTFTEPLYAGFGVWLNFSSVSLCSL